MLRLTVTYDNEVIDSALASSQQELDQWLNERASSFPEGYQTSTEDISAQENQKEINKQSRDYLNSTDWMVVRFIETGVPVPQEVTSERSLARSRIVE